MKAEEAPDLGDDREGCSPGSTGRGKKKIGKAVISINDDSLSHFRRPN